jgi:MFS family permease
MVPVLRNRDFRRLWAASTIDAFGSWLLVMAVPLHVFELTGSAMSTGLALAVQGAPAVLVGPWAGVIVDRRRRKTVLVVANVASAVAVSLMLFDGLVPVYAGLAGESIAVCFLRPALGAVTPSIVGRGADLAAANALSTFTTSAFRMLGPLMGTVLVAAGWFPAVVLADAACYLAAAAIVSRVAIPPTPREHDVAVSRTAQEHDVAVPRTPRERDEAVSRTPRERDVARSPGGLGYAVRTPLLRGLLITSSLYWTLNAALTVLLIPFVAVRLDSSGRALGYLIAGLGLGYLGGSALSRTVVTRYPARVVLVVAYASVGVCFLVLFSTTALPVALVAIIAAGVPGAVVQIAIEYHRQTSTSDAVLGRVSATFYTSDCVARRGIAAVQRPGAGHCGPGPHPSAKLWYVSSPASIAAVMVFSGGASGHCQASS